MKFEFKDHHHKALAKARDVVVGCESQAKLFFLPFHTTNRDAATAIQVASVVTNSILSYRRKALVETPAWLSSFRFEKETDLLGEREHLQERIASTETSIAIWERYKSVLVCSGELLRERVIELLKDFFGLSVDALDEGREDFKILGEAKVLVFGEVKGTNGGIKREYISQVDAHRDRAGVSSAIPGVLVINNEMDIESIEGRLRTAVPEEQIRHARKLNIVIVRTIDLLFLMRHLEANDKRGEEFQTLLQSGGGWLSADAEKYGIGLAE